MAKAVLVTVGTTKFEELVRAVDSEKVLSALSAAGYNKLIIQKGNGSYEPAAVTTAPVNLSVECFDYTPSLAQYVNDAALVISHAGSGSIFETLTAQRPLIVVPNPLLMDNHQVELGDQLQSMGHLVCARAVPSELAAAIIQIQTRKLKPYSPGSAVGIATAIDEHMGFVKAA